MNGVLYKLRLAVRGGATRSRTASIGPATYLGFFHNQIAWKDQWHTHAPKARSIGIRLDHLQNDDQLQSQKDVFTKFSSNGPREVETEKDHSRILDPYLPLELRSQSWLENLAKFEGIGSVESLAGTLLAYLTNTSKVELLSLLGLQYGRWPAFLSLTKTLLDSERPTERLHVDAPWNGWAKDSHLSLRELLRTWEKESIVTKQLSHQQLSPSLDDMTKQPLRCLPGTGTISTSDRAGYVFLSLGCLLIEATNLSPERSREILSYVHQLLAMMHHYGLVPASIYDYTPEMEASGVHKPPSLHLLQSRILTILSDAAWSAMEKDITREGEPMEMKYARDEKELSKGEFRPRIRPLSPEIWLDFILWCCVETGRLSHAAWLITRLSEGPSTQSQWHTVGWPVVEEKLKLEETTRSPLKMETAWRRLLRVTGATENYSEGPPVLSMDPKTVSNEVVLAILDGLISLTSQTNDQQQANYGYILRSIKTSFALCQTPSNATEAVEWNKVLLRLCELFQSDLATTPGSVMTSLNPHHSTKNKYAGITHLPDGASAQFGLLTLVLQAFIDLGYQRAALKTFQLMQEIFHGNCLKASGNFRKLARPESNDEATMRDPDISDCSTSLQLQIPDHTLAAFIDYTTSLGLFEIPESLLFSRDTDAPFIQPARYSSSILQPALLRYAAARHDGTFLAQVATYIRIPMSNENLHALLQCQIALDQWDGVYSILDNMKDEGLVVSAAEVALIAKSVFLSRHRQNRFKSGGGRRSQSDRILEDVLQGSYDARPAASGKRDYSRIRLLNQLARMISSMNPQMERLMRPYVQHQGTLHTPVLVPADAFEVLLGAIVEADGPYAGQSFWQQWCLSPSSKSNDPLILDGTEKVIIPRLQGVVAATRPLANGEDPSVTLRLKGTNERARQLESQKYTRLCQFLRWAVTLYRQFGYSEAMVALEIRRCLPGLTPPQQHDLVNRILATE